MEKITAGVRRFVREIRRGPVENIPGFMGAALIRMDEQAGRAPTDWIGPLDAWLDSHGATREDLDRELGEVIISL